MGYKLLSSQLDTVCTHFGKVEATWQREANQEGAAMGGDTIQPMGITDKKMLHYGWRNEEHRTQICQILRHL